MEKLPPTSYVRLVDIWLINGQLVPFLEVILLTVLELKRETSAVNHHGFSRFIKITTVNLSLLQTSESYTSDKVRTALQAFVLIRRNYFQRRHSESA